MASVTGRALPARAAVTCVVMALIAVSVAAGQVKVAELLAAGLAGYGIAIVMIGILAHWSWLVYTLGAVDLLIPEDDRYTLHGVGSAFQMEPYRVLTTVMLVGWLGALMVDPRVRARKTKFDGPVALLAIAIAGSEIFNATRVSGLSSFVIKALVLMSCLLALLYVLASVIRTRETIDRLLSVLVCAGLVEAFGAIVQRETKFNLFDHIHRLIPMFSLNLSAEEGQMLRNGHFRALSSAGHPIELANVLAMLTPIAAYLAIRSGKKIWWAAVPILLLGNLSSGSRTGIIGLLVIVIVFVCLRPRETLRCWPALIPMLLVLEVVQPGAISGAINSFFPKGGLIAQQSATFAAHGQVQDGSRLSRLGPQLRGVFEKHNEFFGEGFGTRVLGRTTTTNQGVVGAIQSTAADNAQILDDQWLANLLETGLVGVVAWLWLFTRAIRRLSARAKAERGTREGWLPVTLASSIMCYATSMYLYDAWTFLQGTVLLILLFGCASALLWLPPAGATRETERPADMRRKLILPSVGSRRVLVR